MKILMLSDSMVKGGTERRITELLKGLKGAKDLSIELVVFSSKIEYEELYDLKIPIHFLIRKSKRDPRIFFKLFRLCKRIKPDIIHSWGSMATIYALPLRWFQPVLLINAIITDAPKFKSVFDQRLLRLRITAPSSDLILANSNAGLLAYGAPKNKSAYIFNGFDFNRLSNKTDKLKTRVKYGIPDKKVIGMVGAFAPRKDYQTYLQLAQQILAKRDDVVFVAVGDGPLQAQSKRLVNPENKPNIIFTGAISDVEDVIGLFDIGVLISNPEVHGEGISNAILEYMAAGKPVLANDNGGNAEIILDGKTGFIIAETETQRWVDRINFLLDHPAVAAEMGLQGRGRVESTFHIDQMIASFRRVYQNLVTTKHAYG